MSISGRLDDAKDAAIAVIETLTFVDYFGVIEFNTDAAVLVGSGLRMLPATGANIRDAVKKVCLGNLKLLYLLMVL